MGSRVNNRSRVLLQRQRLSEMAQVVHALTYRLFEKLPPADVDTLMSVKDEFQEAIVQLERESYDPEADAEELEGKIQKLLYLS